MMRVLQDPRDQEEQALYVVDLPVTTESACAAGRELWGFPKYVTPIDTEFARHGVRVRVGRELCVSAGRFRGPGVKGFPFVTYSVLDGELIRTVTEVRHWVRWSRGRATRVEITGKGPCANTIHTLGLDGARAAAAFRTDAMRAALPHGVNLGSPRAPAF